MKIFAEDGPAKAARLMLDWSRKQIPLYQFRGDKEDDEPVWVDYELVRHGLDVDRLKGYSKAESAIRDVFDGFLEFLERFESFIEAKVVKEGDFKPYLHYWTRMLSGNDETNPEVTKEVLPAFWKFVTYYRYEKVLKFVDRYDKVHKDLRPKTASRKETR